MDLDISLFPEIDLFKNTSVKDIVTENIKYQYKFGKILGEGAFGKVKKATLLADASKVYAIKSIPRHLLDNHHREGCNHSHQGQGHEHSHEDHHKEGTLRS